jgi:DNA invertase Pin-like site-specific DNA recombinase
MKMEYFVYCRKSSEGEERQALSLPAQERELKQYAVENNIQIKQVFKEAKSARIPNKREKFDLMIKKIRDGECKRILCWHTNRLSRNPLESGIIIQLLTDGILKEILTPQKSISTKNANDILLGVEFGSNAQYSRELSYNTKRGIREKINRGQWPSCAPAFYVNVGDDKLSKNIEPNPESSPYYIKLVDEVIRKRLNYTQATDLLNSWDVKTKRGNEFSKSSVHRFLQNPVYYGLLKYSDYPETQGTWKPLISKSKWDKLQEVLNDKSKPYQSKWYHPYKKIMKCGKCGLSITGVTKVKSGNEYTYYTCTKRHGNCGNPPVKPLMYLKSNFVHY